MSLIYYGFDDKKIFFLLILLSFSIFLFTTDGHRYTIDEDIAQQQTKYLVTEKPSPLYEQGKSTSQFMYPPGYAPGGQLCYNAILCSTVFIGHSITEAPFYFLNYNFHFFTKENTAITDKNFDDPAYVYWRNSLDPNFTFLEFFYGPFFSALSVGFFYLICKTFNFGVRNSIFITLLYGFATMIWSYSKTSLNGVPLVSFILISYFFFRRYQKTSNPLDLIYCGSSIGFAFLVRPDAVLLIVPLFFFLLYELKGKGNKIKKLLAFVIPVLCSYLIWQAISYIRFETSPLSMTTGSVSTMTSVGSGPTPLWEGIPGMLFSPGVGLFIFAPILLTMFFSFPDFYNKNKRECLLFMSFIAIFLIYYGANIYWHGLVAWGERYLLPVVAFMLIPLGASLEKRKNLKLRMTILSLGIFGAFFNLVYVLQDVSWFVWSMIGTGKGLFSYGTVMQPLQIHPVIIWTFEYSQLTRSIVNLFENFQPDIFLLNMLGPLLYGIALIATLSPLLFILIHILRKTPNISENLTKDNS